MKNLTRKYKITFKKHKTKLVVTYHNNNFKSVEYINGGIHRKLFVNIGYAVPLYEAEIKDKLKEHPDSLFIELIEDKKAKDPSEYKKYSASWFAFYNKEVGCDPRFNGVDGKHLKEIIKYLQELEKDNERAYNLWLVILSHWRQLDKFFSQNKDLPFINSQLNKIIQNVQRISHKAGNDPLDTVD